MKLRSIGMLAALLIMTLSMAMAWPKSKQKLTLPEPTIVGNITLQPGEYTIDWTGTGPDVQVTFSRENKTIAIAQAKLEAAQNREESVITTEAQSPGSCSLVEINFKKSTLRFTASDATAGN